MGFLEDTLDIKIVYRDDEIQNLPNFINVRYSLKRAKLEGIECIFVYPKKDLDSINAIKKHLDAIRKVVEVPIVLILNRLTYREKEYLLKGHIPFVVENKQIYLPFMATYLQKNGSSEKNTKRYLLPSSELLLLYYIYQGAGEMLTSKAVKDLSFTPTSISRASKQLEDLGLIESKKSGIQKCISSPLSPKDLFLEARKYMVNPIKRTIYISKDLIEEELLDSGYTALAEYSSLNPSLIRYKASFSVNKWEKYSSTKLLDYNDQLAVELWRYDPKKLAKNNLVDPLSLALSLFDDHDERVESMIEEMLEETWRKIDVKRY